MSELGLCVNVRSAMPDRAEIAALGLTTGWLRTICYDFASLDAALAAADPATRWCVILNSETEGVGDNYSGWPQTVGRFCAIFRGRVHALEAGNEFDLLGLPDTHAARVVNLVSNTVRAAGMKMILGSVAGPDWPAYLRSAAAMLAPGAADYCALHPYGQRAAGFPSGWGFGELVDAVSTANAMSGLPVALTECGIKIGDAGGEDGQAEYVRRLAQLLDALPQGRCPFACYFAWTDSIGAPHERGDAAFGLRREDGSVRPAWQAFALAHNGVGQPPPPPIPPPPDKPPEGPPAPAQPRFQLGFARWAELEPDLIGQPVENEYGPTKGLSAQRTTAGRLLWANLQEDPSYFFWGDGGGRWLWRDGWPASQLVGSAPTATAAAPRARTARRRSNVS